MSVASETLPFFRDQWAERLVDSCVIKRADGSSFSDVTGQTTIVYETIYLGVCLVRPTGAGSAEYGEQETAVRRYRVFIPDDETGPQPGDLIDVTSTRDGHLDGNTLVITGLRADTYNTVRALDCEENQDD
ncbi:MAG: DUF6093 family protein [Actinobacteria bacterium]|nr:DUF6093 family protein [Actinomycetota bacterium]